MRSLVASAVVAATLFLASVLAPALAAEPKETVDLRNAVMWSIAAHLNQIKAAAPAGDAKTVAAHAAALKGLAPHIPTMFPEGTSLEVVENRAKPEIWADWDKFVEAAEVMETRAGELEQIAKDGAEAPALVAAFATLGKEGCGGCHKPFRAPKD
ncbi:MAG: cytochrome c [Alphaproteobacteria bacterium]|nr:cytochrome c [Alphaproteobacteria bacterium]